MDVIDYNLRILVSLLNKDRAFLEDIYGYIDRIKEFAWSVGDTHERELSFSIEEYCELNNIEDETPPFQLQGDIAGCLLVDIENQIMEYFGCHTEGQSYYERACDPTFQNNEKEILLHSDRTVITQCERIHRTFYHNKKGCSKSRSGTVISGSITRSFPTKQYPESNNFYSIYLDEWYFLSRKQHFTYHQKMSYL